MNKFKNQNPHQWGQTCNMLSWIKELVKNRKNKFGEVMKYLMEEEFTYMEKFDGTNIAKILMGVFIQDKQNWVSM